MSLQSLTVASLPVKKSLVTLAHGDDMDKSFGKLFDNRILSAPVLDDNGNVTGIVAMIDIAVFAVNLAKTSQALVSMLGLPIGHPELLSNFDNMPDLLSGDKRLENAFGADPADFMKNFSRRNPTETLKPSSPFVDLLHALTKVRRVVVTDEAGKLVNYITQSDLLKFLSEKNLIGDKGNKTIAELKVGSSPVISMRDNQRVLEAFKLFALHEIEAVPVLDEKGTVIGNVSATDIRVMKASADAIDSLYLTYDKFRELMTQFTVPKAPVTVTSQTTLNDVLSLLLTNKIHRVYVVDSGVLKAVVSMTDILKALY